MAISKIKSESIDLTDTGYTFGDLLVSGDLTIDTSSLTVDSTNNRVGIGTTTPNSVLTVEGPSGNQIRVQTSDTVYYRFGRNSGTGYLDFWGTQSGFTGYTFGGTNGERMRIDSSGNVGIGTSDPQTYLHVAGSATILDVPNNGYSGLKISDDTSNDYNIYFDAGRNQAGTKFYFRDGGRVQGTSPWTDATPNTAAFISRGTNYFKGSVGIGTTSPTENLHVYSTGNTDMMLETPTAGSDARLFIKRNGSSSRAFINFQDSGTSATWYTGLLRNTGTAFAIGQGDDFGTNTRFVIETKGNIGIGTTSPAERLDVNSDIKGSRFYSRSATSASSTNIPVTTQGDGYTITQMRSKGNTTDAVFIEFDGLNPGGSNQSNSWIGAQYNGNWSSNLVFFAGKKTNTAINSYDSAKVAQFNQDAITFNTGTAGASDTSERFRIDSSGNVGIGTTSPSGKLHVVGNETYFQRPGDTVYLRINTGNGTADLDAIGGVMRFRSDTTERMRIDSSGRVGIGTTSMTANFEVFTSGNFNTQTSVIIKNTDTSPFGGEYIVFQDGNGTAGSISSGGSGSVAYNTSSDYRLKENVVEMTGATDRLKQLSPKRFNFIADANKTVDGFLAHEVQSVVPEAITGTHNEVEVWKEGEELPEGVFVGDNKLDDEGNTIPVYQGIDQSKLVPLLVATIKELEARITALENA